MVKVRLARTVHDIDFSIGDIVYLRTDTHQEERMIVGICLRPTGVTYCLMCGLTESWHYGMELTTEKDVLKAIDAAPQ